MLDWIKILIVGGAIAVGVGAKLFWPSLKDDNPIEEVAEKIIEQQTGVDIDLSPSSPESEKK